MQPTATPKQPRPNEEGQILTLPLLPTAKWLLEWGSSESLLPSSLIAATTDKELSVAEGQRLFVLDDMTRLCVCTGASLLWLGVDVCVVEHNNKFYPGTGYAFKPFPYGALLDQDE